ncbi:hypothetical protein Q1695_006867 [Nippostrongylus brasiliensis]|nr:hypothetical protein Q1695_006867 [Nippostrongylus brasiliensis]
MSSIGDKHRNESILERMLRDIEEKERIFETYKVASGTNLRFQTRSIMNFIDFEMSRVIRVPLHQIYAVDPSLCEMLCNTFFGRTKCWRREGPTSYDGYEVDLWPSCRFHLYAGMLCTYACVVMERLFRGVHDVYQAAIFAENRCFHEQRTLSLLNDVFRRNARIAINAIDIDYEKIFKMGESQFFKNHLDANKWKKLTTIRAETCWGGCCRARTPWRVRSEEASIELMAIAYRAKAMDFLAHNCCQSLIERRWHGRLRLSPTSTLISYLFPCFIYKEYALRKSRGPELEKPEAVKQNTVLHEEVSNRERLVMPEIQNTGNNTRGAESPLIAYDASTPNSIELDYLTAIRTNALPHVDSLPGMKLATYARPRFPAPNIGHSPDLPRDLSRSSLEGQISSSEELLESPLQCAGWIPCWLISTLHFYTTTKAKFFYHVVCRMLYVILYSWVLVAKTRRRSGASNLSIFWPEILVAMVQLSQLFDSAVAIRQKMAPAEPVPGHWLCNFNARIVRKLRRLRLGFFEWSSEHLFGFYRNAVIVANCITLTAVVIHSGFAEGEQIGFWAALATMSDLLFHVSFLFATVSMIRYLSVFYFFSVLTFLLRRMVRTLGKFLLIFVIFWVIFAVCHISIAEEYAVRSNHSLAWMIFQNGAFEIFGEVDDEDKVGTVTGCEDTTWQSVWTANTTEMRCLLRSSLIPITVFTYMLVASIMLVNLLTALLSKEYDDASGGRSDVYWRYENYFLLTTYESKLWLPPPLSLLYYALHTIPFLLRVLAFFSCILCTASSNCCVKRNPFLFIPSWLNRLFRAIEGRPWGSLKQMRNHRHDESDLEEVRKLVPGGGRVSHSEQRIQHAQLLFQEIFNVLMECVREETQQIRTRANTAAEEFQQNRYRLRIHFSILVDTR